MHNKNWRNKLTDPTFTTNDSSIEVVDAGKIKVVEVVEVVDAGEIEALVVTEPTPKDDGEPDFVIMAVAAPVVIAEPTPAPVVAPTVHRVIPTIF